MQLRTFDLFKSWHCMIFHVILPLQVDELYSLDLDALNDLQYVVLGSLLPVTMNAVFQKLSVSNNWYLAGQFMGL